MEKSEILTKLKRYKKKYAYRYGITTLGVFGSVARNQIRVDSDLDVFVQTKTPNPFLLVHIKEDIEKLVNRKVEIVRLRENMNPYLKDRIAKEGIYV